MSNQTKNWKKPDYISTMPYRKMRAHFPRNLVILGSTGSIGCSTLAVLENLPITQKTLFNVLALAGGQNIKLLAKQALLHRPAVLAVQEEHLIAPLTDLLLPSGYTPEILYGPKGYAQLAALQDADLVVSAQVGAAGLAGTLAAARAGKMIALANKESLVLAGDLIRIECAKHKAVILPVDSEHNAIFQLLMERFRLEPAKVIITASGGPFLGLNRDELKNVSPEMALKHPNWSMGAKISIDSATLMNKGLEVIEAYHLYGLPLEQIDVAVHPQSIVHSAIAFSDGSIISQMSTPDMKMPIAHALGWPKRIECGVPKLDLTASKALSFERADTETFPCLKLAYQALTAGPGMTIILNAANEIAVDAFLNKQISFLDIPDIIDAAMQILGGQAGANHFIGEQEILKLDQDTRAYCLKRIGS